KPYGSRLHQKSHPVVKRLFEIMEEKQSNLGFSCDCTSLKELISLMERIGPHIAILKIHSDMMTGWGKTYLDQLNDLATKHQFLLFEDRKFVDIGNTAGNQLYNSTFKMLDWADFISATLLSGQGCISGLAKAIKQKERQDTVGLVLLAESAAWGSFANGIYTKECIRIAKEFPETVLGFIALGKPTEDDETDFLTFATDIDLFRKRDGYVLCQTPEEAISKGVDVIFVGKALLEATPIEPKFQADQWKQVAKEYQHLGWNAY
ncbi:orotidine 5'-phosphate decarboxylase PyrG, partial [Stipitochalara longipes BDJ]